MFFSVFHFPLKLAVSSFVTGVAIYQVLLWTKYTYITFYMLYTVYLCFTPQTALLLVVLVVPTLHIVRAGIDENIAFLLLGFGIVLSDDRMEVVRIVTFYTWLLEGLQVSSFYIILLFSFPWNETLTLFSSVSVLPLCNDPVLFGQCDNAHEVHGASQVCTALFLSKCGFLEGSFIISKFHH